MMDEDVAFLLAEHGYDLTLERAGAGGTYDPATGGVTGAAAPTTSTLRGVFIDYNFERINDTTIQVGDRKLLIQAKDISVAPKIGDIVGGMDIVGPVRTIKSGDTVIAYTAQTRA